MAAACDNWLDENFASICGSNFDLEKFEPEPPGDSFVPSYEHSVSQLNDVQFALQSHLKLNPKGERLGKVADWTAQLNQNRLNRYANSGSLNLGDINDLLGEDIPIDQLKKPFSKTKQSSYGFSGGQRWNKGSNSYRNSHNNRNSNAGGTWSRSYGYRKPWDSYRGGNRRSSKNYYNRQNRRTNYRNQGVINEAKIFKDFIPISSSWNCLYKFDKAEIDHSKPTNVSMKEVKPFVPENLVRIHQNASLVSPKSAMAIKNSMKTPLKPLDDIAIETMEIFSDALYDDTHIFISSDCLAMMLASGSSLHSLYFDVDVIDSKKLHVFLKPENFLHLAQLSTSSLDAISNIEKLNPGDFYSLCEENTKINCTIRNVMLKGSQENFGESNLKITKIKLGTQMTLQVVGYCHGKDKSGNPMHLRTLFETPNPSVQPKHDWRTQLVSRQDSVLVTENKMNRFQILWWIISAFLSGVDNMTFAYVSRKLVNDNSVHSLLDFSTHSVKSYLQNTLCFDLQPSWEVVKSVLKKSIKLSNSFDTDKFKMVIYFDARKDIDDSISNILKIYECPVDYELSDEDGTDDDNDNIEGPHANNQSDSE